MSRPLTGVNDTNVTATLSGSPTNCLLRAVEVTLGWTGVLSAARGGTGTTTGARTLLSSSQTFYFDDGGNDTTGTGTSGAPWATIQHALDTLCEDYDFGGQSVTVKALTSGTYAGFTLAQAWTGGGALTISGADSGTTTISTSAAAATNCVLINTPVAGPFHIQNFTLTAAGTGNSNGISVAKSALITHSGMTFGACTNAHMQAGVPGAKIEATGDYTITGGAGAHWLASDLGTINCVSRALTLTGTPAFSFFALAQKLGLLNINATTYSGSATGYRGVVASNAVIFINATTLATVPGNDDYIPLENTGGRVL